MCAFQQWPANGSRRVAPRSGEAAAQRNEGGRVLKEHAPEKRHRRNSQRVGAWARDETDEISGLKSGWAIALFHGHRLQCETISKSASLADANAGSGSCRRLRASHLSWLCVVPGQNFSLGNIILVEALFLTSITYQNDGFFSGIHSYAGPQRHAGNVGTHAEAGGIRERFIRAAMRAARRRRPASGASVGIGARATAAGQRACRRRPPTSRADRRSHDGSRV
jgi:hypothetical protein